MRLISAILAVWQVRLAHLDYARSEHLFAASEAALARARVALAERLGRRDGLSAPEALRPQPSRSRGRLTANVRSEGRSHCGSPQ